MRPCFSIHTDLMHPSMLSPREGGQAWGGDFDIFIETNSKSPPLGYNNNIGQNVHRQQVKVVKCPLYDQNRYPGDVTYDQNPYPGDRPHDQTPVVSPTPPPWGLTLLGA